MDHQDLRKGSLSDCVDFDHLDGCSSTECRSMRQEIHCLQKQIKFLELNKEVMNSRMERMREEVDEMYKQQSVFKQNLLHQGLVLDQIKKKQDKVENNADSVYFDARDDVKELRRRIRSLEAQVDSQDEMLSEMRAQQQTHFSLLTNKINGLGLKDNEASLKSTNEKQFKDVGKPLEKKILNANADKKAVFSSKPSMENSAQNQKNSSAPLIVNNKAEKMKAAFDECKRTEVLNNKKEEEKEKPQNEHKQKSDENVEFWKEFCWTSYDSFGNIKLDGNSDSNNVINSENCVTRDAAKNGPTRRKAKQSVECNQNNPKNRLLSDGISHFFLLVGLKQKKMDALYNLMNREKITHGVIFCNSQDYARNVATKMNANKIAASFLNDSELIKPNFLSGSIRLLVVSERQAPLIDTKEFPVIINLELPGLKESYYDRIGKSENFNRKRVVIYIVNETENVLLKRMESHFSIKIEQMPNNIRKFM